MSDDAEIERALAEVTAKQNALEAQLQNLRDAETAAIAVLRARADAQNTRIAALERERLALVERANEMSSKRRVVLGLAKHGKRLVQALLRAVMLASLMFGGLMLSVVDHLPGAFTFAVIVICGMTAALLGDHAEHSEQQ